MGMAASQARYLGLTARKTNVEYEGQQINQARTALSNQSASLWNQMLSLSVPTVPSTTDYTKVQYSFSDGYNDYTISALQSCDEEVDGVKYNTQVSYYYYQDVYKAIEAKNTNPQVQYIKDPVEYSKGSVNTVTIKKVTEDTANNTVTFDLNTDPASSQVFTQCTTADVENIKKYNSLYGTSYDTTDPTQLYQYTTTDVDGNTLISYVTANTIADIKTSTDAGTTYDLKESTMKRADLDSYYMVGNSTATPYDPSDTEQKAIYDQMLHDFPDLVGHDFWVYEKNGKMYFASESDLKACIASGDKAVKEQNLQISSAIDYQSPLNQYYAATQKEKIVTKEYAIVDDSSGSGRFSNIKLQSMSETFDLQSEEVTDQNAYNDAMNQYNYDVTCYEKAMADINAKTSVIQEQDRTLELRLKQLDTEQKA
ncbi:MAG: hypothetical protein ACI4SM_00760, partial [Candidatus Gastranaerophilaceae bacterium]